MKKSDPDSVHDLRVYLRKYYDVSTSLYPFYDDPECFYLAKRSLSLLGKIRDMDICGLRDKERDKNVTKALNEIQKLNRCYLGTVCCSRLLIYNKVIKLFRGISDVSDFHELRKVVRKVRNLVEALDFDVEEIKIIAKKMGDIRDEMLRLECRGVKPFNVDINPYKEEARKAITKVLLKQNEFHHFSL
ncbi:MAG: CHAD domain-containing protein [Sulfolobus sp.]|nr:CHAD domain-containing protein [Sulfolobus sp.]